MKIAYVLVPIAVISGKSNGIRSQALSWKKSLEENGNEVVLIDTWGDYDWNVFDIIHVFGTGQWLFNFVRALSGKNNNIVLSPIIDSYQNPFLYYLSAFFGSKLLRLWSPQYTLRQSIPYLKSIFVRSQHEANFINRIAKSKISHLPLATNISNQSTNSFEKEEFCLHISSISQPRKNVIRLIQAAKKYDFKLILAGNKGNAEGYAKIKNVIGDATNIEVLGFVSEKTKHDLYNSAKVFALPSIIEGVGIVALDAAACGCEIVITSIGGPKEYYSDYALVVDPFSVDEIGEAIVSFLNGTKSFQPKLRTKILNEYSSKAIGLKLEKSYKSLILN